MSQRVFISHTSEIGQFPKDHPFLQAALDGAREAGWATEEMGDFPATPMPPAAECERRVQSCDAFVAVVGFLWGSQVPGRTNVSYVELEYDAAQYAKKPCLIFVIDENATGFPVGLTQGMSDQERKLQADFRNKVLGGEASNGSTVKIVSSSSQLQHAVFRSVSELAKTRTVRPIEGPSPSDTNEVKVSTERLPAVGGTLFGRDETLRDIHEAWESRRTNVVCLVGPAGSGKTALTNSWLASLADEVYRGATAVFAWSFESQEADQSEVSAERFVAEALRFFGEHDPPGNPVERGRRLAQIVSSQSAILVLDGLEAVQDPREPHELRDTSMQVLLKMLAAKNNGLCLLSSLIEITELKPAVGKRVKVIRVEQLSIAAGTALLKNMGIIGPERELTAAVQENQGHPLSLTLLAARIRKHYKDRDIRHRTEQDLVELSSATKSSRQIERWLGPGPELEILRLLGLFNRPAPVEAVDAIRAAPAIPNLTEHLAGLSQRQWWSAVANLRELKLLVNPYSSAPDKEIDTNATFRQQSAQRLRSDFPDAWKEANSRLFEYYLKKPSKALPDTREEMAHLFQAIVHGCRADRHQDAFKIFWDRIRHGEDGYSVTVLNAWGDDLVAISNFFVDGDWERPSPNLEPMAAALVCAEASFDLRGHGRLDEAIGSATMSLRRHIELGNWWNACDVSGNLSELQTLHGDLEEAEAAARKSIEFANKATIEATDERSRSDALLTLSTNLATLADVLHQRGKLAEAAEQFGLAERTFREVQPDKPYLYRLRGYHYCDLLLSLGKLDDVNARAAFAAQVDPERAYGVALAHLGLARRLSAYVQRGQPGDADEARVQMDDACRRLRKTGHSEMILRGMLASAELHRLTGDISSSRAELGEVLESAARVQMKLLEADAQLQLAHLEAACSNIDAARVHLDISRGMVQAFAYERRSQELQNLETFINRQRSRASVSEESTDAFKTAQRRFVELFLHCNPLEGTQLGIAGNHDFQLPPVEPRMRADLFAELTASAHALRAAAEVSSDIDDIVDGELAVAGIRGMRIVEDALRPYARNPGVYLDGIVRGVYTLLARTDLSVEQKIEPLTKRLAETPELLDRGRRQVSRAPRVLVDNAIGDAQGVRDFFQQEMADFIHALPDGAAKRDLSNGCRIAVEAIQSFQGFIAGLTATATNEFALGRTAFEALLHDVHHVNQDADELLDLGTSIAADLHSDLERASMKTSGHARWWEAITKLEERHPTRDFLLDDYRAVLERARDFVQQHDLLDLTKVGPLIVRPTPPFARANLPFAAYIPSAPFAGSGHGEFWVTTPSEGITDADERAFLRRHHPGRLLVACVHEAYPGHHAQFDHAAHVKRPLRHFFASNVFSEGWGLYCEDLMRREGFLMDGPDGTALEISMLRDQLWRALRIVIDVGLHCKGLTREQAVSMLVDKHVLDTASAESEVMYYCSAPTQPMSYMTGRILMSGIIEKCRSGVDWQGVALGRIRDQVLSHGSLPFPLLDRLMGLSGNERLASHA